MKAVLNSASEIICVGASSEEIPPGMSFPQGRAQEERRAARRAEKISVWVREAFNRPIPVRKLNVGHHAPTGSDDTSDQRRVIIILVLDHDEAPTSISRCVWRWRSQSVRAPIFEALLTKYSLGKAATVHLGAVTMLINDLLEMSRGRPANAGRPVGLRGCRRPDPVDLGASREDVWSWPPRPTPRQKSGVHLRSCARCLACARAPRQRGMRRTPRVMRSPNWKRCLSSRPVAPHPGRVIAPSRSGARGARNPVSRRAAKPALKSLRPVACLESQNKKGTDPFESVPS